VLFRSYTRKFTKPKKDDGTVSKKALIAKLSKRNIKVAIDFQSPDSQEFDVVRFDFTGKGQFNDQLVVPLKKMGKASSPHRQLGPATFQIQRDGKSIHVTVRGHYYISSGHRYIVVFLGTALEGPCKFGDKTYKVRLVDGNNNLRCGDKSKFIQNRRVVVGDTLLIDLGDGNFKHVKKSLYGSPVLIDGVWYDVALSPDKSEITASPSTAKTAKLKINHDSWSIQLVGKNGILMFSGSTEPTEIPAGKYRVMQFTQSEKDKGGRMVSLTVGQDNLRSGKAKTFNVEANQTFELAVGTPLTARVKIKPRGRSLKMNFELTDVSGMKVGPMHNNKPQVEVFDVKGELVHTGKFEYG